MVCMTKSNQRPSGPARLAIGQLWKANHFYIQIVKLGKRLIHYRMLSDLKETGARIKSSSIDVLWGYLQSRHARLVAPGHSSR